MDALAAWGGKGYVADVGSATEEVGFRDAWGGIGATDEVGL